METKKCRECGDILPHDLHHFVSESKGGKIYLKNLCLECKRSYEREKYAHKKLLKKENERTAWQKEQEGKLFKCKICNEEKLIAQMKINNVKKNVQGMCKKCDNLRSKKWRESLPLKFNMKIE